MDIIQLQNIIDAVLNKKLTISVPAMKRFYQDLKFEDLLLALKYPDEIIRCNAIIVLYNKKDLQATELLISALEDSSYAVCGNAARGLGYLKAQEAIKPLIKLLIKSISKEEWTQFEGSIVRCCAAAALGDIEDKRALPALQAAFQNDKGVSSRGWTVKRAAADAIEYITKHRYLPPKEFIWE